MAGHKFGLDVEGNKRAARPPTETAEERAARKRANETFRARHYRGLTPQGTGVGLSAAGGTREGVGSPLPRLRQGPLHP